MELYDLNCDLINGYKIRCNNHQDITVIFNAGLTINHFVASFQEEHEARLHGAV